VGHINGGNLNKVRSEGNDLRDKKREYLKGKINDLATHNNNIRDEYQGIN
jgi:hypothetical protein